MLRLILLCSFAAGLAGCTQFPKLDAAVGPEARHAAYPKLAPIGPILADSAASPAPDPSTSLSARGTALRAKASKLYDTPAPSN